MRSALKVFIVEDNPIDRDLVKRFLRQSDRYVFEFAEEELGSAALRAYADFHPDCILLDLNLPDMNGLEFLKELPPSDHTPPVVVTTASGTEQIAVEAMKRGAADYVVKGNLTAESLLWSIENSIEKNRLRIQIEHQKAALKDRNSELEAALVRERSLREAAEDSRHRYRALTEAIPQVVWTASHPNGSLDHVSAEWTKSTGLPGESALGSGWTAAIHPDDQETVSHLWRKGLAGGSRFEGECRLGSSTSGYRWHLLRAVPQWQGENIVRWIGTFTDIEDRKRSDEMVYRRQKLESTGLLAGGIAHDFNNLLVGILGGVSYALDTLPQSHVARPMLENAREASERASMLTRQMLAHAGKTTMVIERIDLGDFVRSTCDLLRASIPRIIQVNVHTGNHVPPVASDPSQIQQVIMNLIMNAAEAIGEERPGIVTVRTGIANLDRAVATIAGEISPGVYSVVEVIDTGPGMSEETQARIFEPFFSTKFTGRGLGLAAVLGIIRSNKGGIQVQSSPGHGSTFRVFFPAAGPEQAIDEVAAARPSSIVSGTILVVDDEQLVHRLARAALERDGHVVHSAISGHEALAKIAAEPNLFDLILLDMNMPDLDGEETLRRIREINTSVPVVVCSGYTEAEVARRFAGQAISGFLQKPFTSHKLATVIGQFLSGNQVNARA